MNSHYSKDDIIVALKNVGICKGDNVFIHSNLGFFGKLANASNKEDYYKIFKEAIFEIISDEGTLIVPTFSYSFCKGQVFDIKNTAGVCGMFSEMVRLDTEALRSGDANFSVAAIGKNSKYFTENAPEYSFGSNSFWERLLNQKGKICNFNFDSGSTFIHYIERLLKVEYRYDKEFRGMFIDGTEKQEKVFYHFVYDLNKPQNGPFFGNFDKTAKNEGISKVQNLGKGQIVSITAIDTYELIKRKLEIEKCFLTKQMNVN